MSDDQNRSSKMYERKNVALIRHKNIWQHRIHRTLNIFLCRHLKCEMNNLQC